MRKTFGMVAYAKHHGLERWDIRLENGEVEQGMLVQDLHGFYCALLINGSLEYVSSNREELMGHFDGEYATIERIWVA